MVDAQSLRAADGWFSGPTLAMLLVALLSLAATGCGGAGTGAEPTAPATSEGDSPTKAQLDDEIRDPPPAPDRPLPELPTAQLELHGTFGGEPFWVRLGPDIAGQGYGGRPLRLVYEAPAMDELGGTILADHPWLLTDSRLRIIRWDERSQGSKVQYVELADSPHYQIQHEIERVVGEDVFPDLRSHEIPCPEPVWDRRLAPVFLALAWRADSSATVPVIDLMAHPPGAQTWLSWEGESVSLAGSPWRIEADAEGRLARLLAGDEILLEVSEHLAPVPRAEAIEQERAFMQSLQEGQ